MSGAGTFHANLQARDFNSFYDVLVPFLNIQSDKKYPCRTIRVEKFSSPRFSPIDSHENGQFFVFLSKGDHMAVLLPWDSAIRCHPYQTSVPGAESA